MLIGTFLYGALYDSTNTPGIDWWRHVWQVAVAAVLVMRRGLGERPDHREGLGWRDRGSSIRFVWFSVSRANIRPMRGEVHARAVDAAGEQRGERVPVGGDALRLRERLAHQPTSPQREPAGDPVVGGMARPDPVDNEAGLAGVPQGDDHQVTGAAVEERRDLAVEVAASPSPTYALTRPSSQSRGAVWAWNSSKGGSNGCIAVTGSPPSAAIRSWSGALGADPVAAMQPFEKPFDEFHAHTRPRDWLEGLVKAYVGDGLAADFYREVAAFLDRGTRDLVIDSLEESGQSRFVIDRVRAAIEADHRVGGRLALWGRRLMGEALSQAQRVAADRDALTALLAGGIDRPGMDLAALGRMFARLTENHTKRMDELGLDS